MVEFRLPDVGEGMHEGEIISWFVQEGDHVKQDEPVVEVQTDKMNAELTAPVSGKIKRVYYKVGEVAEVGSLLFTIDENLSTFKSETHERTKRENSTEQTRPISNISLTSQQKAPVRKGLATPYVRQLAREMNINLEDVVGTGPGGRVLEQDLQNDTNLQKVKTVPSGVANVQESIERTGSSAEKRIPLKGIRKAIAEKMIKSVATIPHVTHVDEIEMDALKELREQLKHYSEQKGIKLTFLPFFIKAIVSALKEFEYFNASIDEETNEIVLKKDYHIGIATDTEKGLIVPVIQNADQKSLLELAGEITQLSTQARKGTLNVQQMTGSTFTISNVGPIGGLHATPIINYPEVAILALHKMEPRNVVREWESVIKLMMNMSLSFDHRLVDGATAVRFTNRMKELIENPNLLLMELR
ncbi:dihydrolipoamide acetyltransferase family protein [Halalkalibacterium halodurans]|jgi:pyruvate dehydrogenase E2 component (dihydrolipoamide acetyltransferase)|uniref:Dihydrolipoamide acetyltransferase component of pyruvate dehydrogenase complex n=2 Tax=Halalkalibacterium halodurans TaxID=86665 RepID=Q9KG97_HALH5|nr:dihydrolipoamide acetyltransferase family protein [Halalkalibacterium halodurans]MDY7220723.1 dihydrolipoamide acetyltransferase family protein [Halalkalibacterium halodurans]MDY7239962.1 dihydrolipoamide acetyltransferase family protein [Halalkalibacterium halodurans]MED4081314.1 dihydrolipoamide acetyltransferase family protein [Halalkalibacterium halodurans]MED4084029.1 dihydrolipoamide acetyltransferase family protein [Halalkalibacterium halodurans]MED4105966.1 dihydrolipoamide acetyltr